MAKISGVDSEGRLEGFSHSLAVLVGIDRYGNGVRELRTAVADALKLAEVLHRDHGFETEVVVDENATCSQLRTLLADLSKRVGDDDRVLFYFAGHGIATEGHDGPRGYILGQDATRDSTEHYLSMVELHDALSALSCRHMLVILDCCFAGAFRWSSTRDLVLAPESLHQERYAWFVHDKAWQAIASTAYDQKALDVAADQALGVRGGSGHSPFAQALIDGLAGAADRRRADGTGDGVITATELYLHVVEQLMPPAGSDRPQQIPILWPLRKHKKGEFVFLVPGEELDLPPAPPLDASANPWRGLKVYESTDEKIFYGRRRASETLRDRLLGKETAGAGPAVPGERFIVVTGPSGIGKSSLVRADLLPRLPKQIQPILVRPGSVPFASLATALRGASTADGPAAPTEGTLKADPAALATWVGGQKSRKVLLVIDQTEELFTMSGMRPRKIRAHKSGFRRYIEQLYLEGRQQKARLQSAVGLASPKRSNHVSGTTNKTSAAAKSSFALFTEGARKLATHLRSAIGEPGDN